MRLYYYTSLKYGLAAIRDQRIKISHFDALNDPFDFIGVATDTEEQRKQVEERRDRLKTNNGLICMSETWKSPLLWGHYADCHKGVCLIFNVDDSSKWRKVKYTDQRKSLDDFGVDTINDLKGEDFTTLCSTKFKAWEYEQEWRLFPKLRPARKDFVDGNFFYKFSDNDGEIMRLDGIIFGARCKIEDDTIEQFTDPIEDFRVGFVRPANSRFDIILDQQKNRPWVSKSVGISYSWLNPK